VRVFLDTNVLVATFATRGPCADIFRLAAIEHDLLIEEPLLVELERVFDRNLRMPRAARSAVLQTLRRFTVVPAANAPTDLGIGDRDDEWIIACALAAAADVFVTGDQALLRLRNVTTVPIVSPRDFWTGRTLP
jgi:predicted nucleic acid-binding protein